MAGHRRIVFLNQLASEEFESAVSASIVVCSSFLHSLGIKYIKAIAFEIVAKTHEIGKQA